MFKKTLVKLSFKKKQTQVKHNKTFINYSNQGLILDNFPKPGFYIL